MSSSFTSKPVEVFAGSMVEAGMVQSLLENADIRSYLKDELMGTFLPWYASPGGAGSVKVIVSDLDYVKARFIVDEYEKNINR